MSKRSVTKCPLCEFKLEFAYPGPYGVEMLDAEEKLYKHLKEHTVLEWVRKVTTLQSELEKLKATFP